MKNIFSVLFITLTFAAQMAHADWQANLRAASIKCDGPKVSLQVTGVVDAAGKYSASLTLQAEGKPAQTFDMVSSSLGDGYTTGFFAMAKQAGVPDLYLSSIDASLMKFLFTSDDLTTTQNFAASLTSAGTPTNSSSVNCTATLLPYCSSWWNTSCVNSKDRPKPSWLWQKATPAAEPTKAADATAAPTS